MTPPKNMKRAERRVKLAKMKAYARKVFPWNDKAHHLANNMAFCSNSGCPCHYKDDLLPPKERRQKDSADEQLRNL